MSQQRSDIDLFRRVWPTVKPDWPYYMVAFVFAPASAALTILLPWLLKRAVDDAIVVGDGAALSVFAGWYLAAVLAGFVCEAGYTVATSYGATRTIARLRRRVFAHTVHLSPSFFDQQPTGRLLTRATADVDALGETLSFGAVTIVLDVLLVCAIVAAMFALDARLTFVLLLVGPPLALVVNVIRRQLRRLFLVVRETLSELNAYAAERLSNVELVQLASDEARTNAAFGQRLRLYRDATIKTNVGDALLYAVVDGVSSITMAMMLAYAASPWIDGVLTAGLLAAFIDYVGRLFTPIREFSGKLAAIQRAGSALEKIYDLLDEDDRITAGHRDLPPVQGPIVFRDVDFAYRDGPDVLRGVSFRVDPGEVVAFVGRTGSGKSTIGKLLLRAYDGYRGSIMVDGVELRDVHPQSLQQRASVVQQDVTLFPTDVRSNLTLGQTIDDTHLRRAIELSSCDALVERLGGLDGAIRHGASNLSVGEAQLLSFARTLARTAPLVIMDEATASVDTETEARIQAATKAVLRDKTVLVVAHRLSTIAHADRIVVLDQGRVAETGTHAELLANNGIYSDLYASQFETSSSEGKTPAKAEAGSADQ